MITWETILEAAHSLKLHEQQKLVASLSKDIAAKTKVTLKIPRVHSWTGLKKLLINAKAEERPSLADIKLMKELDRRLAEYDKDPSQGISGEELRAKLKSLPKRKYRKPLTYRPPARWKNTALKKLA